MIHIRDVEILDILPYTFKTPEYMAMSKAIKSLNQDFYDTMSSVLFWADIDNAAPEILDLMAAEVDAPFYSIDMTLEQKRASVAAAYKYNRTIGTTASVENLVSAAFKTGEVSEWFEYGGEDFYFKLDISRDDSVFLPAEFEILFKKLNAVKPKRAKLDYVRMDSSVDENIYTAMIPKLIKSRNKIQAPKSSVKEDINSTVHSGGVVVRTRKKITIGGNYTTYGDLDGLRYSDLDGLTWREIEGGAINNGTV